MNYYYNQRYLENKLVFLVYNTHIKNYLEFMMDMNLNLTLALVFGILLMLYLTMKFIVSTFYKFKRKIVSKFSVLKILGLTGVLSTANFQLFKKFFNQMAAYF